MLSPARRDSLQRGRKKNTISIRQILHVPTSVPYLFLAINGKYMQANDIEAEKVLLNKLKSRDIRAFKCFYKEYSDDLLILAYSLLENATLAIAAVDELFERLWIDAKFEYIDPPIHRFLTAELRKNLKK